MGFDWVGILLGVHPRMVTPQRAVELGEATSVPCLPHATAGPTPPPAAVPNRGVTAGWWPGPVAEGKWGQDASSGFQSGHGCELGFSCLFWFVVGLCGLGFFSFSKAVTVLKMLRTWRGSAVEVFEASQLVFSSAPSWLGRHRQPEACPTDGKPAEPQSGFATALVPAGLPARLRSQKGALHSPAVPGAGAEG